MRSERKASNERKCRSRKMQKRFLDALRDGTRTVAQAAKAAKVPLHVVARWMKGKEFGKQVDNCKENIDRLIAVANIFHGTATKVNEAGEVRKPEDAAAAKKKKPAPEPAVKPFCAKAHPDVPEAESQQLMTVMNQANQ